MRVLIVDDSRTARMMLRRALPPALGTDVLEAAGGTEAIRRVSAERIDLMFLDLTMPDVDGYQVLKTLQAAGRTPPTIVVARYGGEEFVVFLPGEDVEGAALAAERLREAARAPFKTLSDVDLTLTISLGVTGFRPETADPKVLLAEADHALYASKEGGRNRVSTFRASDARGVAGTG